MKKLMCLILSAFMLTAIFSGCQIEGDSAGADTRPSSSADAVSDTVTILTLKTSQPFMTQFLNYAKGLHPDIKVEVEYLSDESLDSVIEYETRLQQIRTEIMAGKGPDVFILPASGWTYSSDDGMETVYFEPLFSDVTESMYTRIFLPLDEYISGSQHIRPENYPAAVVEAGRSSEGQVLMPLSYSYNLLLMDKTKLADPEFTYSSLDDILNSDDEVMVKSFGAFGQILAPYYLTDIANYENNELLVTQEDITYLLDFSDNTTAGYDEAVIPSSYGFAFADLSPMQLEIYRQNMDIALPMYMPNKDGGITALINSFSAVNANTPYPEEAFKVLELLYSDAVQLMAPYSEYNDRFTHDYVLFYSGCSDTQMHMDINFITDKYQRELVESLNAKITSARFYTSFEDVLKSYISRTVVSSITEGNISYEEACFRELQMELAE